MKINLRRATAEDAGDLARAHVAAWLEAYRGLVPDSYLDQFTVESRTERFRTFLATNPDTSTSGDTWVVESGNQTVGFVTIGASRDSDTKSCDTGEIWGIYLAPQYWRRGIGSHVCSRAERMLASRDYSAATLWVLELNQRARRFYEAMGFVPDGASKKVQLGAPLKALRYRKELK
jgi:ribosomal protein S18 acetylase RimI-like enzyme